MSSSGLIYAVIVGAWAAYLVPMWLRRQDELNEARPTERFSTAIRLLSGRAGMERRYAKDLLRARSGEDETSSPGAAPDGATDSVDVRAFAVPPGPSRQEVAAAREEAAARQEAARLEAEREEAARAEELARAEAERQEAARSARTAAPPPRRATAEATARARRSKVLARRRRTTVVLFLTFTAGALVAAVGGLGFLWVPAAPGVLLSAYIVYLRRQERRRFAYVMDRQRAELAAQRLRERQPRRPRPDAAEAPDRPVAPSTGAPVASELSALAADRRALVEQTDHAEWVDQQRERQRGPVRGDSWDPVPVPLPTYVTAPVAPRATGGVDLGAPDTWSSARSSAAEPTAQRATTDVPADGTGEDEGGERTDARRAASARRSRERGRTPLFDQYEDQERPRAANE
ncbi:gephyrin-like molybdotransferase receptor GlpR [Streptomyces sp. NPDC049906]|uniref:divisome protein SepX/GlpR n=1 Tax=Streptomyces sp. NPDC049906 TaxID=3155656 RepID=UPI003415108C